MKFLSLLLVPLLITGCTEKNIVKNKQKKSVNLTEKQLLPINETLKQIFETEQNYVDFFNDEMLKMEAFKDVMTSEELKNFRDLKEAVNSYGKEIAKMKKLTTIEETDIIDVFEKIIEKFKELRSSLVHMVEKLPK
jgi:hypothetical protein